MDAKFIEQMLGYIPISLIAIIVTSLLKVSIASVKHVVTTMYEEQVENNSRTEKRMDSIDLKMEEMERRTVQIQSLLGSYVTVERHYSETKSVNRDIMDMRERKWLKLRGELSLDSHFYCS